MSTRITAGLAACLMLAAALPARAQVPRTDVFWARTTDGEVITLDGHLTEPAWALAESVQITYAHPGPIPTSGWKSEGTNPVSDTTHATLKFLTVGNRLYMAAIVPDSSVGGSADFNVFDGFLMSIKDRSTLTRPTPPAEYTYTWWYPNDPTALDINKEPGFIGMWGNFPPTLPRTATQIDNWDAVTVVNGVTNSDTTADDGYVTEMMFNLTPMGYDVTQPGGDIVEFNISIYDCDWRWPVQAGRTSSTRTWWQGPWANASVYNEVRMYSRPDVTIHSGPVPDVPPELVIPNAGGYAAPVIDGDLSDPVWALAPSFDIRYGDDAVRATYPSVGPYRSGQYQPPVNGGMAAVLDPGDATVKYFFKGDWLYLGFDVRDQVVQYVSDFDRWDGFIVSINDRQVLEPEDHVLQGRRLSFQVGPTGAALPQDYLAFLADTAGGAQVAIQLKPNTTVDTVGTSPDEGYTAELAVDLTQLGYPPGLGDGVLFLGLNLLDGDSFTPFTDSYGDRTWWFREYENTCGPVWAWMDPNVYLVGVPGSHSAPTAFASLGVKPNPVVRFATLRFSLPVASRVGLEVFDLQGRRVATRDLGRFEAGTRQASVSAYDWAPGLYLYRLKMSDPVSGAELATLSGKMMRLQ